MIKFMAVLNRYYWIWSRKKTYILFEGTGSKLFERLKRRELRTSQVSRSGSRRRLNPISWNTRKPRIRSNRKLGPRGVPWISETSRYVTVLVLHALSRCLNSLNARIFANPIVARVAPPVSGLAFQKASSFPREKFARKLRVWSASFALPSTLLVARWEVAELHQLMQIGDVTDRVPREWKRHLQKADKGNVRSMNFCWNKPPGSEFIIFKKAFVVCLG